MSPGAAPQYNGALETKHSQPTVHIPRARRYFVSKLCRVKKAHGQIISCNEIFEKNPTTIKNYGIWVRYESRTGFHNMYKEFRDTTLNGAIDQLYTDMASRHRVR